jgi:SET domain-containing protein
MKAQVYPPTKLYINHSAIAGLGVFASENIKKGEIIEVVPVILLPEEQISDLAKTNLLDYFFAWGEKLEVAAFALGYGSLYNHSYEPNAKFVENFDTNTIIYSALRDIKKGEEILINYNGKPDDMRKLWFLARDER